MLFCDFKGGDIESRYNFMLLLKTPYLFFCHVVIILSVDLFWTFVMASYAKTIFGIRRHRDKTRADDANRILELIFE